ncbi:FAD/NAD(P)-binding domain-containing protein [Aaosphaeria arxii CBS 175.79]|uniref:FAD/NAD(P)-binding domain-containing protein n=1 Tax=Aaosphaeria arxii CBS 175.79 TaxID=1450172 RepID=A0A6A5XVW2_9PLEO|nr:FAD/NAD(P)-binding domain-containing protein [Aaosphaeria arxii CBS 175.79]KAF2017458.1 FAD/NAD(P)-binding domain-containing protein [Aaosphaeria arxii CBS 175.79]
MTTESIVILGGSFAGLSAAHYVIRHVLPQLPKKDGTTYAVTLVNPSKDFYWRIAGPRAIVSQELMPSSKYIYPIEPAFAYAKDQFKFVQGTATHVDAAGQTVSVTTPDNQQVQIPYIALVVATGVTTASPLFTLKADSADFVSQKAAFQKALATAKTVVIGGGGPVAVESAGEIAEVLNGKPGWFASAPKNPKAKVTVVSGDKKLLPILRESISNTAEKYLNRLGADVIYNTKVVGTTIENGKTIVKLSDDKTIEADIYLDATGVRPNTSFLPKEWLDNRNRVACDPKTLRVTASPRVYAVGDVGSYTRGGVMDQANALPVALTNLKTDLIAHLSGKEPGPDRHYTADLRESQIVPIGTQKGVGAFGGNKVPSQMVWLIKGRDYMISQLAQATLDGAGYKKEGKWKPEPATAKVGLSSG